MLLARYQRILAAAAVPAIAAVTAVATHGDAVAEPSPSSSTRGPVANNMSMAAAIEELSSIISGQNSAPPPAGYLRLLESYGGSQEILLRGHLTVSVDKKSGAANPSAAHGSIMRTIAFRQQNDLDRADVVQAIETARCRSFWPFAFTDKTADGSPVEYCRLSRLSVQRILSTFDEDEVVDFFALWCEHTLRLLGDSKREGAPTQGTIHVYDCRGVRWSSLISDARQYWSSVARIMGLASTNWPGIAEHYVAINAPYTATLLWKLIAPLAGEHVKDKVTFSRGVPPELLSLLGGEAAVERMQQCSPHVAPPPEP